MAVAEVAVRTTQRRGETRASITHTSLSPDAYLLPPSRTLIARCPTLEAMAQHSELLPVPKPLSTPSSVDDLDILCTLSCHTCERTRSLNLLCVCQALPYLPRPPASKCWLFDPCLGNLDPVLARLCKCLTRIHRPEKSKALLRIFGALVFSIGRRVTSSHLDAHVKRPTVSNTEFC
jgi:hypothetical protein